MVWLRVKFREPKPAPSIVWGSRQTMSLLLGVAIAALSVYLVTAFLTMQGDPSEWTFSQRGHAVLVWLVLKLFVIIGVAMTAPVKEDKNDD